MGDAVGRNTPGPGTDARFGYALALGSSALIGLNFITASYALRVLPTPFFLTLWFGSSGLLALAFIALSGRAGACRAACRAHWVPLVWIGVTTAGFGLAHFWGLSRTDPTVASLLARAYIPASVLLGVVVLRENLTRRDLVASVICLAGVFVVFAGAPAAREVSGPVAILIGTVLYAASSMVARQIAPHLDPMLLVAARSLGAAAIAGVLAAFAGQFGQALAPTHLGVLLVGAFVGPFLGHLALFGALARVDLARVAVIQATQPVFVAVIAWLAFRAAPGVQQGVGGLIIVAGTLLLTTGGRPQATPPASRNADG